MTQKIKINMFQPYISKHAGRYVMEVLKSRWIGQGAHVSEFEEKIRTLIKSPHVVAVNNGASAVRLALSLAGVGPGDEVITTPQTCTATNHPILEQYAVPVFADIQYLTGNIDPNDIEHRITEKTKAIICVHWGGYPCDLEAINDIAEKHDLAVIEDASDALGATYKEKPIGSISRFTCFSFQAIQQITCGEGGALCVLNKKDFETACAKRWFGIDRKGRKPNNSGYYDFDVLETGYGYHMTNIAAAMGIANLEEYETIVKRRSEIVKKYRKELERVNGVTLFNNRSDRCSANQIFTLHVKSRGNFYKAMKDKGIESSIVHMRNDLYTVFGGLRKDLPVLDEFEKTNISIPLHNRMTDQDVSYIISTVKNGW